MTVTQLNSLSREEFARVVGPVVKHSRWIAEATWAKRSFASVEELHRELLQTVVEAGEEKQLALIRAHPDLVGRLALSGQLTKESTNEQASAGLDQLTPQEVDLFSDKQFRLPGEIRISICHLRALSKKDAILNGFRVRLQNSRAQETQRALAEIGKIAASSQVGIVSGT